MTQCVGTRRDGGFTLVEVLVALAVLAIGLTSAYRGLSGGLMWIDRSRDEAAALAVAEALLARLGPDIPLQNGSTGGRVDNAFTWRLDVSPYDDLASTLAGNMIGHRVAVTVTWTAESYDRSIRLITMRIEPRRTA